MGEEEANQVLLAIGKMQGTLNGVAGDIKGIKKSQAHQYEMIDDNRQKITVLETINKVEDKVAAKAQPSSEATEAAEEAIAIRYIRRHWLGATFGGIGVGGGLTGLGLLYYLVKLISGDPTPLP